MLDLTPFLNTPQLPTPDYTGVNGMPEGLNIGALMPRPETQMPQMGPIEGLMEDIATGKRDVAEKQSERDSTYNRLIELIRTRGGLVPQIAAQQQVDKETQKTALVLGAVFQAMGARNGLQAATQFNQGLQTEADMATAQEQQRLNKEYQNQDRTLAVEQAIAELDLKEAEQGLSKAEKSLSDSLKVHYDLLDREDRQAHEMQKQDAITGRNNASIGSREKIAADKLALDDWKAKNPVSYQNFVQEYQFRLQKFGPEEADAWANMELDKNRAQIANTEAKTKTENELRDVRKQNIESQIKTREYSSQTARQNANRNWQKWQGEIESDAEAANIDAALTETGIAIQDREFQIQQSEGWMKDAEELAKMYEAEGNDEMAAKQRKSAQAWREVVSVHKQRLNELKKKEITQKAQKPKKGEVPPFNPIGGPASLSGQTGK